MPETLRVAVKPLTETAIIPAYQTPGAAGFDLHADLSVGPHGGWMHVAPGEVAIVPTGLAFAIPEGFELQVRPRSGLAAKSHVSVLNTPGTVDSDYRGEVKVILINHGDRPYTIHKGDRIAQGVIAPVITADFQVTAALPDTLRGEGGLGSTGLAAVA